MYKAIIFDLDGTLIDSLEDLANSTNLALAEQGFKTHEIPAYRYFIGQGVKKLIEMTLPEDARTPETAAKTRTLFDKYYGEHYLDKTKPYDGILEVIAALREKGVKMAVVSNKPNMFVEKITEKLFPKGSFATFLGQRDTIPRKPDPAACFEVCRVMDVRPEDCLYLGDSGVDMETAVNAGMFPVGAAWGFRQEDEIRSHGAKALIHRPAELLELV